MAVKKGTKTSFWGSGKTAGVWFGLFLIWVGGSAIYQGGVGAGFAVIVLGARVVYSASKMRNHHQVTWKG